VKGGLYDAPAFTSALIWVSAVVKAVVASLTNWMLSIGFSSTLDTLYPEHR
jgi:hypothetical protein